MPLGIARASPDPNPMALPITNLYQTLFVANWGANGNAPGTVYWLQVSSASDFSAIVASYTTTLTSATVSNLTPGGSYFLQVEAGYGSGNESSFTALSSATMPTTGLPGPTPLNASTSTVTYQTINVRWNAPTISSPSYIVQGSTASTFLGVSFTSTVPNGFGTATLLGLAASTTYYLRVGAVYNGSLYAFANTVPSSATTRSLSSVQVTGLTPYQVLTTSITWKWNSVSSATVYNVYMATSPTTLVQTVSTTTLTETGLSPNTTFGRRVSSVVNGVEGPLCSAVTTYTLAAVPTTLATSNVNFSSVTLTWSANGNPDGSTYQAQASVNNFSSWQTTITTMTSLTLTGLAPGDTYSFRIEIQNGSGLAAYSSSTTLVLPGSIVPQNVVANVGISSITWSWSDPQPSLVSTYGVFTTSASTIPVQNAASSIYAQTGLIPNTAYNLFVVAYASSTASAPSATMMAYTYAAVPGVPTLTSVSSTSFVATWAALANPPGTLYEMSDSTAADFSGMVSTPIAFSNNFTGTSTSLTMLSPATRYYVRLRAQNAIQIATAFTSTAAATTPVVLALAGIAASPTSITWKWNLMPGATSYSVYASTSNNLSGPLSASTTMFTQTNLTPNTFYNDFVVGYATITANDVSAATGTYTLAAVPGLPTLGSVTFTSIALSWSASSNPSGTPYEVTLSTVSDFSRAVSTPIAFSNSFTGTSAAITNLSPGQTYYLRVRAQNSKGITTAYSASALATTLFLGTPSLSAVALSPTSIAWSWSLLYGASSYSLLSSTGISPSGTLSASTTFFIQNNLTPNSGQTLTLVAGNASGSSSSAPLLRYTLVMPPTDGALHAVSSSSVTYSWSANGNPTDTTYDAFIWRDDLDSVTLSGSGTSRLLPTLIAQSTYYLTVNAINKDNIASTFDTVVSTVTPTGAAEQIGSNTGTTITLQGHDGPITLQIPAQAFSQRSVVTLQEPTMYPTSVGNAGQFRSTGIGVQISLSESVEPVSLVTLTIPFSGAEVAGLDKNQLVLARYDPTHNLWVPYVTRVDLISNVLSADVNHFSLYQVMSAVVPSAAQQVHIFPNPFRPSQGHSSITIANAPASTRVRIYTLVGELVKEVDANAAGMATWDATNQAGAKVASGMYYVLVQGASDQDRLRVVVQR